MDTARHRRRVLGIAVVAFAIIGTGSLVAHAATTGAATMSEPAERGPWNRPGLECDLALVDSLASREPDVRQFIVMTSDSFAATTGTAWVASRRNGEWTCDTEPSTAKFGRTGTRPLTDRRSGDGTTPAGIFPLGEQTAWDGQRFSMFGNRPAPDHLNAPYRDIRNGDCWGATPNTPSYQKLINKPNCPGPDDEWLPKYGDVYSHAAVIGANMGDEVSGDAPGEPAYAAAIFMHRHAYDGAGTPKPTSGCVSLAYDPLVDALRMIDPALNPRFAIGPTSWLASQATP